MTERVNHTNLRTKGDAQYYQGDKALSSVRTDGATYVVSLNHLSWLTVHVTCGF